MPTPSLPPLRFPPPLVATRGNRRTLEFMPGNVQSEMRLSDPSALVLAYTRAVMCFALFVPQPRHIIMVGLGGGSLAKFCYRHFPATAITVIELRADVIALREQFCVPPDDARFRVVHADAAQYMARLADSADVLVVDGFDERGLPPVLGSPKFYADCRRALLPGGVLVKNIFSYDPNYRPMLARMALIFDGKVCWFDGIAGNNRVLFALRQAPPQSRAAHTFAWVARRNGLPAGWLNRLLARWTVFRLALRK
ncbi:MAG: transferase spermidine synthase [Pseudomonadota bacterium]